MHKKVLMVSSVTGNSTKPAFVVAEDMALKAMHSFNVTAARHLQSVYATLAPAYTPWGKANKKVDAEPVNAAYVPGNAWTKPNTAKVFSDVPTRFRLAMFGLGNLTRMTNPTRFHFMNSSCGTEFRVWPLAFGQWRKAGIKRSNTFIPKVEGRKDPYVRRVNNPLVKAFDQGSKAGVARFTVEIDAFAFTGCALAHGLQEIAHPRELEWVRGFLTVVELVQGNPEPFHSSRPVVTLRRDLGSVLSRPLTRVVDGEIVGIGTVSTAIGYGVDDLVQVHPVSRDVSVELGTLSLALKASRRFLGVSDPVPTPASQPVKGWRPKILN